MNTSPADRIGRYELLTMLGRGAMGTVYKARDPKIDRLVAIKTIAIPGSTPENAREYRERFFREAQAAGRLSHPGIVTIYDVGEDAEHGPYIVMEYVAGQTLDQLLSGGPEGLPMLRAVDLADQLAQALDCAHAQGIVHRDIKPANIIVTEQGQAKITDFGVAKLDVTQFTAKGLVFGTPAYMSPEQLEGETIDSRSDLFSLGVVLYSMLTGYRPFHGNSAATISFKVMYKDPVPVTALNSALPVSLNYVVSHALAKVPTERYQSGAELALDLQDIKAGARPRSQSGVAASAAGERTMVQSARGGLTAGPQLALLRRAFHWTRTVRGQQVFLALLVAIGAFGIWAGYRSLEGSNAPGVISSAASVGASMPSPPTQAPAAPPSIEQCPTEVTVRYPFTSATLSLWVDDKLAYQRHLRGQAKKRMLVLKSVQGNFRGAFSVPAGEHVLRAQLSSETDGFQRSEMVRGDFRKDQGMLLSIDVHGHDRELGVRLIRGRP